MDRILRDDEVIREGDRISWGSCSPSDAILSVGMKVKDAKEEYNGITKVTRPGGKPMTKEYKKGKTIYLQFNCPTNEDDLTFKGSFNKEDMNPDYPFTQVKLTGDVYEMKQTWKTVKVK